MDKSRFLVFDSGVGGLWLYSALSKRFPSALFYYLSDGENCPYGDRPIGEVRALALACLKRYGAAYFDGVVVACNTLSTNALGYLEKALGVRVTGVFPPVPKSENAVIFATPLTARSPYLATLPPSVIAVPLPTLAKSVEENVFDLKKVRLPPLVEGGFSTVVLACTHYIYLKDRFAKAYPRSVILDGIEGAIDAFSKRFGFSEFRVTTFFHPVTTSRSLFLGSKAHHNYAVFNKIVKNSTYVLKTQQK